MLIVFSGSRPAAAEPSLRPVTFTPAGRNATLEVLWPTPDGGAGWRPVCNGPCNMQMWTGLQYRITGVGVRSSKPFSVNAGDVPLDLRARVGSEAQFGLGTVLTPVGSLVLVLGSLDYAAASICFDGCRSSDNQDAKVLAGALIVVGLATAVAGIVLMVSNETEVKSFDALARGVSLGRGVAVGPQGVTF